MSEVIQGLFLNMNPMVAWAGLNAASRVVKQIKILNVDNEDESLVFSSADGSPFQFSQKLIYFFSEEQSLIFKATLKTEGENLIVNQPEQVMALEEDEKQKYQELINGFLSELNAGTPDPLSSFSLDDDDDEKTVDAEENIAITAGEKVAEDWFKSIMSEHDASLFETELSHITLEEEDQMYEGMRASPRAKPPEGKTLTVQVKDESRPQSTYSLYDLSRGGLSFLVFAKDEFAVGEVLLIKAFDVNKFEEPMEAEIKVVREADEMGIQYKVGCEFKNAQ